MNGWIEPAATRFKPIERDDPSRVGQILYDWAQQYLISPNPKLGRSGAVCPYVSSAVTSRTLEYLTVNGSPSKEDMLGIVNSARQQFESREKNELLSFIIAFPEIDLESEKGIFSEIQKEAKLEFVKRGLMIGEFFQRNLIPGLHNAEFFPLQSPIPLLAIRRMLVNDFPFMNKPEDKPALRIELINSYLSVLSAEMPPKVKEKALKNLAKAVTEEL